MQKVIKIAGRDEAWDPVKQEFLPPTEDTELIIEHSLASISKWEAKWHKAYLGREEKTEEQLIDYIRCMTVNEVDDSVYESLSVEELKEIQEYIADPMTATTVNGHKGSPSREIVTAEVLYSNMILSRMPVEIFEHWHLNRLMTLMEVIAIKSDPNPKKMPAAEAARRRAEENARRRARFHTRG